MLVLTFCVDVLHDPGQTDAGVVHVPDDPGPLLPQVRQGALHPVPVLRRAVDTHALTPPIPLTSGGSGKLDSWIHDFL